MYKKEFHPLKFIAFLINNRHLSCLPFFSLMLRAWYLKVRNHMRDIVFLAGNYRAHSVREGIWTQYLGQLLFDDKISTKGIKTEIQRRTSIHLSIMKLNSSIPQNGRQFRLSNTPVERGQQSEAVSSSGHTSPRLVPVGNSDDDKL